MRISGPLIRRLIGEASKFYERSRPNELDGTIWMLATAEAMRLEVEVDLDFLAPLIILHDIGYGCIEWGRNPKDIKTKMAHMSASSVAANDILGRVGYTQSAIAAICEAIAVHDNWIKGDDGPFKDPNMALFNDLDFLWGLATPSVFWAAAKAMQLHGYSAIEFWLRDEKLVRRPFRTVYAETLFRRFVEARKNEIRPPIDTRRDH